ncbi:hypothetical protein [Salimicrobium album]|uniref:hypothetical protein n=1 Tax=Salimicrobium album TaxID=50717 RepID=UPI000B882E18|nr:hypothetical protein [Salimicrobium album]
MAQLDLSFLDALILNRNLSDKFDEILLQEISRRELQCSIYIRFPEVVKAPSATQNLSWYPFGKVMDLKTTFFVYVA